MHVLSRSATTYAAILVMGVPDVVQPSRWYLVPRGSRTQSSPSPGVGPCAASSRLSTLWVAVVGKSAVMRTYLGHALGDRSGWSARNASRTAGVNMAPSLSTTAA